MLNDWSAPPGAAGGPLSVDFRQGLHGGGGGQAQPRRAAIADRMHVLFDDEHVIVVEKAAGIAVQPEDEDAAPAARLGQAPLTELLLHYWRAALPKGAAIPKPILVQRLDADTSGLLAAAKNVEAGRKLQQALHTRVMKRQYWAWTAGRVHAPHGLWRSRLGRGPFGIRESIGAYDDSSKGGRDGKQAATHFRVIKRLRDRTLLELELDTGRTHQIRIHAAEAGHPVLGDPIYTSLAERILLKALSDELTAPEKQHPYAEALQAARALDLPRGGRGIEFPTAPRLMLHAVKLSFPHPVTGEILEFRSDPPEPFR